MNNQLSRRDGLKALSAGALALTLGNTVVADGNTAHSKPTKTSWASFRNGPEQQGIAGCKLAANPRLKWEVKSKDGWVATSAIVGNHVYAPALQGYLHCFDKATGKEIWKYRSIDDPNPKTFAPGFKAAPLVTDKAVYVGDEDGLMHAIHRTNGKRLWKFSTGAEIAGGVAVYKNNLLLASHDNTLYCLDEAGKEQWSFPTDDMINCSPGVAEHFTFLSGCDAQLRIIDLDDDGKEVRNVPMESHLVASPAIYEDMLYVGSHAGDFAAVNWKSGEIVWQYRAKREMPYHASAAVTADLVIIGNQDKNLHGIDRKTGKARWVFPTKARVVSSAALVDHRAFFGSGDGNIYGVNIGDGKEVWKYNSGKPVNCGVAIGEECLVVGQDDFNGKLMCFE